MTDHIQFYTDIGQGIEDLSDPRTKKRGYDEEEEEKMEE